jgi:hypothetical protein
MNSMDMNRENGAEPDQGLSSRHGLWWLFAWLFVLLLLSSSAVHAEAVCAEVKIEIQQELTLERQAFDAHMKIHNDLDSLPLKDVTVVVNFKDEEGHAVVATSDPDRLL